MFDLVSHVKQLQKGLLAAQQFTTKEFLRAMQTHQARYFVRPEIACVLLFGFVIKEDLINAVTGTKEKQENKDSTHNSVKDLGKSRVILGRLQPCAAIFFLFDL